MIERYLPGLIVATLLAAGGWWLHHSGVSAGRAEVVQQWQQAQAAYDAAVRQREDQWAAQRQSAATQRQEENKDAVATIARVRADHQRVQRALTDAIKRLDATERGAAGGAGNTGDVLAHVCSRAGEVAAVLAEYADRERASRRECQAAWPRSQ